MYSFESSWLKRRGYNTSYSNINVSNMKLSDIQNDFIDGYIVLSNPALSRYVYYPIQNLIHESIVKDGNKTLNGWFASIGDIRLNTVSDKPKYNIGTVVARDAILSGLNVAMSEPYRPTSTDAVVGHKTHLFINGFYAKANIAQTRVLTTVNGFLHRNYPFEDGIQVIDGGSSWLHSGSNNTGIISFEQVGDITQIALSKDNIHRQTASTPYYQSFLIDLDLDITNKSIILSLGGYMFVSPKFCRVVNSSSGLISVDLSKIDIVFKVLNSYEYIDLSSMNILTNTTDLDYGKVRQSEVISDVSVLNWLNLPQSFVTVVDTPSLTVEYLSLQKTGSYGVFDYHEEPKLPLMDHYGRLQEYWINKLNDGWLLRVANPIYKRYLYKTGNPDKEQYINEIQPYHVDYLEPMNLLKIESVKRI